jgi:uncharacterized membrane protein
MNQAVAERPVSTETAKVIYILYLVGIAVGLTSIVGVIMAYINKDDGPDWLQSHYRYQIRTFWISILYGFITFLLCLVLIGLLLIPVVLVWLIVRCVKGLKYLDQKAPLPDPASWGF